MSTRRTTFRPRRSSFRTASTSPLRRARWQAAETRPVVPDTGREVVADVDRVDAGRLQGGALQVQRLRAVGLRDAGAGRHGGPQAVRLILPALPLPAPCQVGRLACTHSRPIRPRSGRRPTRSERRQPPAGRTPPPAGPGTAVRPPSRGREDQRPRDGRRTPALATAHPAGLKNGPARRVRLSQIPGQGRRWRRATAAAERPGRRISAFHLDGAGKERGFAAGRHFLATTTAVPDEGAALSGRPA